MFNNKYLHESPLIVIAFNFANNLQNNKYFHERMNTLKKRKLHLSTFFQVNKTYLYFNLITAPGFGSTNVMFNFIR